MTTEPLPRFEFETRELLVKLDVTVAADLGTISPVVAGIMQIVGQMQCAAGREFAIELALREALANAIVHGCGSDRSKSVQCSVACDQARGMLIVVRDPGTGFDPASLPSPVMGQNVFSEHGRGIYLINQLMDDVQVVSRGGTEIVMRKNPPTA